MPSLNGCKVVYVGWQVYDVNFRRAIVGTTWVLPPQLPDMVVRQADLNNMCSAMRYTSPANQPFNLRGWSLLQEQVYPTRIRYNQIPLARSVTARPLNPNAPEAAWRLQRVGVSGAGKPGLLRYPIFDDSSFADLPRRRHVITPSALPFPGGGFGGDPHEYRGVFNQYWYHAIIRRDANSWEKVDHLTMLPNPIRIWQRWRQYEDDGSPDADFEWCPPVYTHDRG